jgi:hypothetical protein
MSVRLRILLVALAWLLVVTFLHLWLNTRVLDFHGSAQRGAQFRVGFLPVT